MDLPTRRQARQELSARAGGSLKRASPIAWTAGSDTRRRTVKQPENRA